MPPRIPQGDPFENVDPRKRRYMREHARAMPVSGRSMVRRLGGRFVVSDEDKKRGKNEIVLAAVSTRVPGLFEVFRINGNIYGDGAWVDVYFGLVPSCHLYADVLAVGQGPVLDGVTNSPKAGRAFERHLAENLDIQFDELTVKATKLQRETEGTREAVESYLKRLSPKADLRTTLDELQAIATPEQVDRSQKCLKVCGVYPFGLDEDRIIWDIAWLCQVLYCEFEFQPHQGTTTRYRETPEDLEALRRTWIVASRLSREPGWPKHDPLVPDRPVEEPVAPWPDQAPLDVPELIQQYLSERTCHCGESMSYTSHRVADNDGDPAIFIAWKCSAGHEGEYELG